MAKQWKIKKLDRCLYLYRFLDGYSNTTFTRNKMIQDLLGLARNHYSGQFNELNQRRLEGATIKPPEDKGLLLTVAVMSIGERLTNTASEVLTELFKQAEGKPVEISCIMDNRMSTVSEKRNRAIREAHGQFIAFVEDDDLVMPDYIDEILKAIVNNPTTTHIMFDALVDGYAIDGSPADEKKPSVRRICKYGLEWNQNLPVITPEFFYCRPAHIMAWKTSIAQAAPPFPNNLQEDGRWAEKASKLLDIKNQVRIDKALYHYRFDAKKTTQGKAHLAEGVRKKSLSDWGLQKDAPKPSGPQTYGFVIASKTQEKADKAKAALGNVPVYCAIGKASILEAYEEGRLHFKDAGRIVYLHDDVTLSDVKGFCDSLSNLGTGLHGIAGSADPQALDKGPWWDCKPCYGRLMQGDQLLEFNDPENAHEVQWLDGFCLVAVNQAWSWTVRGNPNIWHGYDWLACKRTIEAGHRCFTIPMPKKPWIRHEGLGRMDGYEDAMKVLRTLTKGPKDRRDYPNIHEHLPALSKFCGTILDIGCREGAGTDALLKGVEERGGEVWSVDLDDYKGIFAGHKQWHFIQSDSLDEQKILGQCPHLVFDVIFIDTDHTYERTKKELELWGKRVKPGGRIILHDSEAFPGVKKAISEYAEGKSIGLEEYRNCNGLTILTVPSPVDVSVIVLDWNTKDKTLACIDSVRKNYADAEIILIQNGEPFECKQASQVIPMEINLGYAAGVNRGVMAATRKYVCLLNSDTVVDGGLLEKLQAPLDLDASLGITAPYSSYARPPQGNCSKENCPKGDLDIPVVFVCVMMRRRLFAEIGGVDPRLTTFEDDDFCLRVIRKGLKTRVVGGAWISHSGHESFKANELDVQAVMVENQAKFRKKWPRIKVIALAKNEIEALPGFFDQFRRITNQFAILDSGSTDGTLEWAKANGVQVATRDFDRFDSQRNASIEMLGQDADWIIQLDPDERLDAHTIKHIVDMVRSEDYDIYLTHIFAKHPDGSEREWIGKPFLWRNKPEIRWALPVHEKLIGSLRQAWVKNGRIDHVLALHKPDRRAQSEHFYANLAKLPRQDVSQWPIIDYEHPMHEGLKQINVGPLVSLIIPTYKRPELLMKAIASVKAQDYRPVELIVVGDNDPTLPKDIPGVDVLVNLSCNHSAGGATPRNYGLMLSSASLIAYCDDDNTLREDHISSLVEAIEGGAEYAISSMRTLGKDLIFDFPALGKFDTSCLLHKKDLVSLYGWWKSREECGSYAHDWLFVKPWVDANEKCVATKKATLIYNAESSGQLEYLKTRVGV